MSKKKQLIYMEDKKVNLRYLQNYINFYSYLPNEKSQTWAHNSAYGQYISKYTSKTLTLLFAP